MSAVVTTAASGRPAPGVLDKGHDGGRHAITLEREHVTVGTPTHSLCHDDRLARGVILRAEQIEQMIQESPTRSVTQ